MSLFRLTLIAGCAVSLLPGAIVFQDDFDSSLAVTTLNADIPNWTESNGTIDYIKSGGFGITCLGGAGGCIDLDGSVSNAGDLSSITLNLSAGLTYEVGYWFSGNQRGGSADSMMVTLGTASNNHAGILSTAPFTQGFFSYTPLADEVAQLTFSHAGGDNIGIILDSVVVQSVDGDIPEPAAFILTGIGLMALGLKRRTR